MGTEPRFCVNCKHYRKHLTFNCRRAVLVTYVTSEIDGKTRKVESGGDRASDERQYNGPNYCGPNAKFYVEARTTKRLIAWFKQ
ncbi:hypothetical protein [Aeromonas phage phiA014S]|uniref:Uncharacterized protein n=1 Tax=Aeromonas phage phiA014S TaxID=3119845 RepID=A0ABZ2CMN2_9CAUD